jgi:hypothetical protein
MTTSREERAASYFKCNDRERAAFEAGIKLAAVYHQFISTPVSAANVDSLERAIEEGVKVQPFVESVEVHIRRDRLRMKRNEYDYQSLTGRCWTSRSRFVSVRSERWERCGIWRTFATRSCSSSP